MNTRYEAYEPLLRRSQPTSSLRNRNNVWNEARATVEAVEEGSSSRNAQVRRLPLHQQQQQSEQTNGVDDDVSEELSLEFSQHDYRAEARPTIAAEIPRFIEFDRRGEASARLNAIEEGFRSLLQRRQDKFETSTTIRQGVSTKRIPVKQRYPKLHEYTPDEATPLIDHISPKPMETRDFKQPYADLNESNTTEQDEAPRWTPRPFPQMPPATTQSLNARMKELEDTFRISIKENRIQSDRRQEQKQKASHRLSEMLAKQQAQRQESQTTFATDQRVMGSLFTKQSSATGTKLNMEAISSNDVAATKPSPSVRDDEMKNVVQQQDIRGDQEIAEQERQALQKLKESGTLSDSLKAFLREFEQPPE